MQKFEEQMEVQAGQGKLMLRPVGELLNHMVKHNLGGRYLTVEPFRATAAFIMTKVQGEAGVGAVMRIGNEEPGEGMQIEYDDLCGGGVNLYEFLIGPKQIFPVDVSVFGSSILVMWPTKLNARKSRWPDN